MGTVEPVDRHVWVGGGFAMIGGGVVTGIYVGGGDEGAELAAEGGNRYAAIGGGGGLLLYEGVVIGDVGRDGTAHAAGDEQQAETSRLY